jgi:hypothetical protein
MENLVPEHLTFSEVGHLPIIIDFAKKIKLVETLDTMVDSEMELSPGVAIMAMVLDTLSGRTPFVPDGRILPGKRHRIDVGLRCQTGTFL